MPTKEYSSWRSIPENVTFISADFELDSALLDKVISLCNCTREVASTVNIQRRYDGKYLISFPFYTIKHSIDVAPVVEIISEANEKLGTLKEKTKAEAGIKNKVSNFYKDTLAFLSTKDALSQSDTNEIKKMYPTNITKSATSEIYPHLQAIQQKLDAKFSVFSLIDPADNADVRKLMVAEMPAFVYYSNYGNLDAQIYLPHAIKWLNNEEVAGIDNGAKMRTLRVLFDFVKLDPQEVLALGKDPIRIVEDSYERQKVKAPTAEEIAQATEQKAARTIHLNSASTDLTIKFKEWWKQGNFNFRFQVPLFRQPVLFLCSGHIL